MDIRLQNKTDDTDIEALLDLAFGEDRFSKAAYKLREGVSAIDELSFVVKESNTLIATLRFWPVTVGEENMLLLGPIAVLPVLQGQGFGIRLMQHGLGQAKKLGHSRVILVGDEPYYSRLGFSRRCSEELIMPGQSDESRLLALELVPGAFKGVGGVISKIAP